MLIFALFSCDRVRYNNYDFPKHITFPAEGGTQYYSGGTVVLWARVYEIENVIGKGDYGHRIGDSLVSSYDWLTVRGNAFKDGLTITAEPNTSKDARFLTIKTENGRILEYGYIKVRQNGKTE